MYSRLNVLVNEINALGVKDITDLNINRKDPSKSLEARL
jgi:hypothetical protein